MINKINELLVKIVRGKKERLQIAEIRNKSHDITGSTDSKRIVCDYYQQCYIEKFDKLD